MSAPAVFHSDCTVLAMALCLDIVFGELPHRVHPVVWMGAVISTLQRFGPRGGDLRQFAFGAFVAAFVPGTFAFAGGALDAGFGRGSVVGVALAAILLKSTFSLRALGQAAAVVRCALGRGDLESGRAGLRALCSRDATGLGEEAVVAATVESVAENASDSFIAPLVYFGFFGLPGAVFYRAVNTLDAMIGYHGRFEYAGKASARLDDLLNLIPARLTAVLLLVAASVTRNDVGRGWRILRRDGSKTESPNAGRPIAAMAGLLGVRLEKEGHYRLGDPIEPIDVGKIDEAWRLVKVASGLAVASYVALVGVHHELVR